jgi:hypothetical protein
VPTVQFSQASARVPLNCPAKHKLQLMLSAAAYSPALVVRVRK